MAPNCTICKLILKRKQHELVCKTCKSYNHRTCMKKIPNNIYHSIKDSWECDACSHKDSTPGDMQICSDCKSTIYSNNICFTCHFPSIEIHNEFTSVDFDYITYNLDLLFEGTHIPSFNKGICVAYLNINGIQNKFHELSNFLLTHNIAFFSCAESKLSSSTTNNQISIEGYHTLRYDRTQNSGGGTVIYIHNAYKFHEIQHNIGFPEFVEVKAIKIYPKFRKPLIIVSIYKPPYICNTTFLKSLDALCYHLNELDTPYILQGDLNINILDKTDQHAQNLLHMGHQYSLKQLITNPTRVTEKSATLIDHMFTTKSLSISQSGSFILTTSDHDAIYAIVGEKHVHKRSNCKIVRGRNMNNMDWSKINNDLLMTDWESKLDLPPATILATFEDEILSLINVTSPFSVKRIKNTGNRWITSSLLKKYRERDNLLKRAKLTNKTEDFKTYRIQRNACNIATKHAKREYFMTKLSSDTSSKNVWTVFKELTNKTNVTEDISFLTIDGKLTSDKTFLASEFAEKFMPPHTDSHSQIKQLHTDTSELDEDIHFTTQDLLHAFNDLKKKNNNTELEIPVQFLQKTFKSLQNPICHMFNTLFQHGIFPDKLKHAIVTPIYKGKGSRYDASSFRPISVIPFMAKLYEKLLFIKMTTQIESEGTLSQHQHGFRTGRSCQTALYSVTTDIYHAIGKPNTKVGAVFVDLASAFNHVPHLELLHVLRDEFNIQGRLFKVLCDYFLNRSFSIKLGTFISTPFKLTTGCPQGSVISTILFNCYYNQVFTSLSGANYCKFVDDLVFYFENKSEEALISQLFSILEKLDAWCIKVKLKINFSKTKLVIFHKPQNKVNSDLKLIYKNHEIERMTSFKYLGVYLHETLNFQQHFDYVKSKLSSNIGCINTLKKYITQQLFNMLVNSFLYSVVDYGLTIWGHAVETQLEKLQKIINSLIKSYFYPSLGKLYTKKYWANYNNVHFNDKNSHQKLINLSKSIDVNNLLDKCNILSVPERLNYYSIVTVYKTLKFKSRVPRLNEMFSFSCNETSQRLKLPPCLSKIAQLSFHYKSTQIWNSLPRNIRDCNIITTPTSEIYNLITKWCMSPRFSDTV